MIHVTWPMSGCSIHALAVASMLAVAVTAHDSWPMCVHRAFIAVAGQYVTRMLPTVGRPVVVDV
jgi:hypothetical protein